MTGTAALREIVARNRAGRHAGIPSWCTAHRETLQAILRFHRDNEDPILIEATCNQVNQDGGYTGMTPADFRDFVHGLAQEQGIDRAASCSAATISAPARGGPLGAREAMAKAGDMVRAYVEAGFTKIHLDASMACADDGTLAEEEIAARAASLAAVAERACGRRRAPLCHRHRSPEAGRRDRAAWRACRHRAAGNAAGHTSCTVRHSRTRRTVGGAGAGDRHRRPARRRFRQQPDLCLRPGGGREAQRRGDRPAGCGVRGPLDRLPDRARAERAGRLALCDPQGRARTDRRLPRGGGRDGRDRTVAAAREKSPASSR